MVSFSAALRPVKLAASMLGLDSALLKASVKALATESRAARASDARPQRRIDRLNFDCPNDPPNLTCLSLYCRVAANRLVAAPVRRRCAQRRDPLMSNYLSANRAL
jgi:hypothetical protein